jgi:hypothetical protein
MSAPNVSVLREPGSLPVLAVVLSDAGVFFKTESGWSSDPGISLTGEDLAGFFVPAGESEATSLLSELETFRQENSKPATPGKPLQKIFSGISPARLLGVKLQALNLVKLGQQKQQQTWQPKAGEPVISQEQFDKSRAKVDAAALEQVTNDKGEVVPVVFPSND